jgi:hypothetical protein
MRSIPLVLSLSKGEREFDRSWFDRLTTSGPHPARSPTAYTPVSRARLRIVGPPLSTVIPSEARNLGRGTSHH